MSAAATKSSDLPIQNGVTLEAIAKYLQGAPKQSTQFDSIFSDQVTGAIRSFGIKPKRTAFHS